MLSLIATLESVMSTIWRVILAFVILMFMILVHETGHYTAGKILKFKINEFAVGMGPKILSHKKKNGEVVSLRLLPLGGFCAFEGEDGESSTEGAFNAQAPWKRLIVLFSGAFFNFVSAVLICVFLFGVYGETVAQVNYVYDYAPTFNQNLQQGDVIYKINGRKVFMLDSLERYMPDEVGESMTIVVLRDGKEVTLEGITRETYWSIVVDSIVETKTYTGIAQDGTKRELAVGDMVYKLNGNLLYQKTDGTNDFDKYLEEAQGDTCTLTVIVGEYIENEQTGDYDYVVKEYDYEISKAELENDFVKVSDSDYTGIGMSIRYVAYKFSFGQAISRVLPYCGEVALLVLRTLGGLFTGSVGLSDIGGPITTISITSEVVSYGFASVLALIVLISVNLAVFNLLPVPALDGCRMVFVLIEWIVGKPINRKVEAWINGIGLILLLGFVILVDLLKL